jgi:hypothetical protein
LGAAEMRVEGLDCGDVHVVVLHLVGGHVHGLLGERARNYKEAKQCQGGKNNFSYAHGSAP